MVDEAVFRTALDAEPLNAALRLVYSDWLEERGDARALGYRWMGEFGKWPYDWSASEFVPGFDTFDWYLEDGGASWDVPRHCRLPEEFRKFFNARTDWLDFVTRQAAEEALCRVVLEYDDINPRRLWTIGRGRRRAEIRRPKLVVRNQESGVRRQKKIVLASGS
jgi:uncharacterized protein (TIGR02996 family)